MSYAFAEETFNQLNESLVGYKTKVGDFNFIVDAQLPYTLSVFLKACGYNSKHTLDLPAGNATRDGELIFLAMAEKRILITKDDDFLQSYLLHKKPEKLLLIKTGNIRNKELLDIFHNGIEVICKLFTRHSLVEITREQIITHD